MVTFDPLLLNPEHYFYQGTDLSKRLFHITPNKA